MIALLKANLWSLLTLVLSLGIGGGAVVWASGEREKVESTLAERAKVVNQLDGFHRGNLEVSIAGTNIVSGSGVPTSELIEEVNAQLNEAMLMRKHLLLMLSLFTFAIASRSTLSCSRNPHLPNEK